MEKYTVSLEDVPSVNHMYGRSMFKVVCKTCHKLVQLAQGGTYLKSEGKTFKEYGVLKLKSVVPFRGVTGKVVVEATAHWPDRKIRDMNNYAKIIIDCLQEAGIILNDKCVLWREMDFVYDKGVQKFDLTIYKLQENQG